MEGEGMTSSNGNKNKGVYESRFHRLFESAKDGILILDAVTGKITEVNPFLYELLGYKESELLGKKLWDIGLFEDHERSIDAYKALQMTGYVRYEDLPLKTKDGQRREVEFVSNVYEVNGEKVIQCNIRDIAERKRVEKELAQSNESLKQTNKELAERNHEIGLLSEMGDSLHSCVSLDEAYRVVARFSVQLFPDTQGALYATKTSENVLDAVIEWGGAFSGEHEFTPNECVSLRRGRVHSMNHDNPSSSLTCQHLPGSVSNYICAPMIAYGEIQGVLHIRTIPDPQASRERVSSTFGNSKLGMAGTVADYIGLALANLKLREALRQQSIHDSVTGLYNRRYMKEALERELRRAIRDRRPLGLLMFDIDHFKKFNDTYGHEAGDVILNALGNFLKQQVRGNDIPCRYGGEEFLIILPRSPLDECRKRAEKLREEVKNIEVYHEGKLLPTLSFSVGVAGYPEHGTSLDTLLKVADTALYSAKANGRDRVIVGQTIANSPFEEDRSASLN
jgi:diguanylate cyclase (GGDEF)-like protein/PAS domain S-box-containing protein